MKRSTLATLTLTIGSQTWNRSALAASTSGEGGVDCRGREGVVRFLSSWATCGMAFQFRDKGERLSGVGVGIGVGRSGICFRRYAAWERRGLFGSGVSAVEWTGRERGGRVVCWFGSSWVLFRVVDG
jgi:hypothetical protein